jgi:hypothetical protein
LFAFFVIPRNEESLSVVQQTRRSFTGVQDDKKNKKIVAHSGTAAPEKLVPMFF